MAAGISEGLATALGVKGNFPAGSEFGCGICIRITCPYTKGGYCRQDAQPLVAVVTDLASTTLTKHKYQVDVYDQVSQQLVTTSNGVAEVERVACPTVSNIKLHVQQAKWGYLKINFQNVAKGGYIKSVTMTCSGKKPVALSQGDAGTGAGWVAKVFEAGNCDFELVSETGEKVCFYMKHKRFTVFRNLD